MENIRQDSEQRFFFLIFRAHNVRRRQKPMSRKRHKMLPRPRRRGVRMRRFHERKIIQRGQKSVRRCRRMRQAEAALLTLLRERCGQVFVSVRRGVHDGSFWISLLC